MDIAEVISQLKANAFALNPTNPNDTYYWIAADEIEQLSEEVEYWKKQSAYNYSVWMGLLNGPYGMLALKKRIEELENTLRKIIDQAKQEVPDEDILEIYRIARNKLEETEI
jgi:hypothetical protein